MISVHTDYDRFIQIVRRDMAFQTRAEILAPHVHAYYRKLGKHKWLTSEMNKPFTKLTEDIKEDNRAAARRIPEVLGLVGLYVVPNNFHNKDSDADIRRILEENIELLAEAEHEGWMRHKFKNGWRYDVKRDDEKRLHPCLIPYGDQSPEDIEKDKNTVRKYPEIISKARYRIVTDLHED
jgi:hypothetical protein